MNTVITHIAEFVPYPHRNEQCAIGLLYRLPSGEWKARPASVLRKARAIDPSCNTDHLRDGLYAMAEELTRRPEALTLYKSGFGGIRITQNEGTLNFQDLDELEKGIEWAMAVAIEPRKPALSRERTTVSRLYIDLKKSFDAYGWMATSNQTIRDHKICQKYPIAQDEGLNVDFALQNGIFHCLQTIDYRNSPAQKRVEANAKLLTLAMSGDMLQTKTGKYALFAGVDAQEARAGMKLAERCADDVFIHEDANDMGRLFEFLSGIMGQPSMPILSVH